MKGLEPSTFCMATRPETQCVPVLPHECDGCAKRAVTAVLTWQAIASPWRSPACKRGGRKARELIVSRPSSRCSRLVGDPAKLEIDRPAQLGPKLALENEQRDPIVSWVPGTVALAENATERIDRGLPERDPVPLRRDAKADSELDRPCAMGCLVLTYSGGNCCLPLQSLGGTSELNVCSPNDALESEARILRSRA